MNPKTLIGEVVVALAKAALLVFGLIERFDHADARNNVRECIGQVGPFAPGAQEKRVHDSAVPINQN
ncbi:MAG TPA: hypothetical protein VN957_07550 [Chthoniobacterales bacterium]|nr:hypothetical protein [Chthoniobacterales bacterium]